MSKIEQIIGEIEDYLDSCKFQPLSNTKIIVNKEQLDELLAELRLKTPDEIKKYQRIVANRDTILDDAKKKAEEMIKEAQIQTSELISEHEIMQQAYIQANEIIQNATNEAQAILDKATMDANDIRLGAMQYTDEILANLQNLLTFSIENFQSKYEGFISSMSKSLEVVVANREELNPTEESSSVEAEEDMIPYEDYTVDLDEE